MDIKEKIKNLPASPGVYIMKDGAGEVLYIGKANDIRKRVSSYFQPSRRLPERIASLVPQIKDISFLPTLTSAEALIYENGLIKELSPKYNVALRDDKSYPLLKLTINEKFPRLIITREHVDDGAIYYGPYTSAKLLKEALVILQKLFPLRTCSKMPARLQGKSTRAGGPKKTCLQFDIGLCLGPCAGKVKEDYYNGMATELRLFLEGRRAELLKLLTDKMKELSRSERFEEALECRKRLKALSAVKEGRIYYRPADEAEELKNILGIKGKLERIEAFDVSNIMGDEACGSMIYFFKGRPDKNEYRRFKIRTVEGMDDYSMMREIVRRRYTRSLDEKKALPDLIVIDGGKGHLGVALDELKKLSLEHIPTIGIAKEFEHIYVKDRPEPIVLPRESKALHLLERIRDEAHRFAIAYHRKLMSKRICKK